MQIDVIEEVKGTQFMQCKPVSQCVSFFDHGQSHFLI